MNDFLGQYYGWIIGVLSCLFFIIISETLHWAKFIYPKNVLEANNDYYYWRYRNFFISFFHASITGILSLAIACGQPYMLIDVLDSFNENGYVLTAFSLGYFMYDTIEMFTHGSYKGTTELIVHHVLILGCFSNTLYFRRFVGYNMVALMIEISNIFLHFRQLLLLSNYPRAGQLYQVNCVLNLVIFILVRGGCMLWLWVSLLINTDRLPMVTIATALVSMVGITVTTTILFRRLVNADFIVDGFSLTRRKVNAPRVKTSSNNKQSNGNGKATQAEPDLYEAMEDSLARQNKTSRKKMLDGSLLTKNVENVATAVVN